MTPTYNSNITLIVSLGEIFKKSIKRISIKKLYMEKEINSTQKFIR